MADIGRLPPAARLVHIGFPKSGTTGLQAALQAARPQLKAAGVSYPGKRRTHHPAAIAVVGGTPRIGDPIPDLRRWEILLDQVERAAGAGRRIIVSSEFLCEADDQAAARVVDQLGGDSVHVLATMRPLVKVMPSAWQQYVQNGLRASYDEWLTGMLRTSPYDKPTPSFWRRQRHDVTLKRWASIVGPDKVVAIVVDQNDHERLLRQVETLLGMPTGTLAFTGVTNRSLSYPEAELVRHLNRAFRAAEDWPEEMYRNVVRVGVSDHMLREINYRGPKILTPLWARERAGELGAEMARAITAAGISIIGDVDSLGHVSDEPDRRDELPSLPAEVASAVMFSAIDAARRFGQHEGLGPAQRMRSAVATTTPLKVAPVKLAARRVGRKMRRLRSPSG